MGKKIVKLKCLYMCLIYVELLMNFSCKCVMHYEIPPTSVLEGFKEKKNLPVPGTPSVFINIGEDDCYAI